ncbi:diguanylate cyclase [Microvirga sp. BT689]|uniref:GGDEF domain-containing protein n=1 Tax=Microvirga arvi TaxID=2778731 RepID=UPI00194E2603|nr:sensor domain-containing diguanylate cyclase [Microvirga arvi]MBM6583031.1 diguanylate cyclase [Microvirga arvi]
MAEGGASHRHSIPAEAELRLLAEYCTDVIARVGADMTFSYISPSAERMFRRPVSEIVGQPVREFVFPEDLPIIAAATARLVAGEVDSSTITVRAIRGDGTLLWVEVTSRPIGDYTLGQPGDRAVVMRDVTERKALEDQLTAMATKDGLTGLANRRSFDEALAREWRRTVREMAQMSLLLLDLDHFKGFNDAYGHLVGDDCLRAVAAALQGLTLGPGDLIARYGGEEIAIILVQADAQGAATVAERARVAIEALALPHEATSVPGRVVTASIGAATAVVRTGVSAGMPQALLAAADRALYQAKAGGRNRVETALILAAPD